MTSSEAFDGVRSDTGSIVASRLKPGQREPRRCGTASPGGAGIVLRRQLLLQTQKRKAADLRTPTSIVSDPIMRSSRSLR